MFCLLEQLKWKFVSNNTREEHIFEETALDFTISHVNRLRHFECNNETSNWEYQATFPGKNLEM